MKTLRSSHIPQARRRSRGTYEMIDLYVMRWDGNKTSKYPLTSLGICFLSYLLRKRERKRGIYDFNTKSFTLSFCELKEHKDSGKKIKKEIDIVKNLHTK